MADYASRGDSTNLDFLRSLAVLMVLFDHICRHYYLDRIGGFGLADIGTFGVLLFFVHTSLVLMRSMHRSGLTGLELVKNFYIRRFFRIYPLSIIAVLAAVALHLHANGRGIVFGPRPSALELASNLLLVQNLTYSDSIIGPLWSLPLEIQMYLVLPFLFLWRKRSLWTLLTLWFLFAFLGHLPQLVPALAWFTLLVYVSNFLPGVIAFDLPETRRIPSYLWPPLLLLFAVIYGHNATRRLGAELCLILGLTIPLFREISSRPVRLVSKWIATYSYGIYLAHSFCIWLGLTRFHSWAVFVPMMIVLPVVLYHGIEHPGIKLGTTLARRISRPSLPEALPAKVE
jgi:peptidoglycan/LPS O-acetylase OafA/YrhL